MLYLKKTFLIVIASVFIAALMYLLHNKNLSNESEVKLKEKKEDVLLKKYKKEIEEIKVLKKTDKIKAKEKTNELISKLPENYKKYFSIGFNAVHDVTFYGRVIDQFDKPVVNAKVHYEIGGKYLSRGSGLGTVQTDQNGVFEISGIGAILQIGQILHSSIDFRHNPSEAYSVESPHRRHIPSLVFYNYPAKPDSKKLSFRNATKESPHIFKAWRINKENINSKIKTSQIFDTIVADGRIYTIDFNKKRREKIKEGSHNGQLKMSCKRKLLDSNMERDNKNDWKFTLEAIDGGLQETNDYYMNSAPLSGYKDIIRISQTANSPDYQHYINNKRYYFTAQNQTVFGAIFIHIKPFSKRKHCYISIAEYKINKSGSRNLATK